MIQRSPSRLALAFAALIAALAWVAVVTDGTIGVSASLAKGRTFAQALFNFLRYFTILTNIGVAALMSATLWWGLRRRATFAATAHGALTVYIVVVFVTYELVLRRLWSPQGVSFYTDMTMHDVVPILTLLFWFACAPKDGLKPWHAVAWLAYPLAYFLATLAAGQFGVPYPYGFIDADKLSVLALARNVFAFLLLFGLLGLGLIAFAKAATRQARRSVRTAG